MGSVGTASKFLRAAFAAVFALMSLTHQPVMAFAKLSSVAPQEATSVAAQFAHHRQQHQQPHQQPSLPAPENPVTSDCNVPCYGLGCFQSVTPAHGDVPLAHCLLLERLHPAPGRAIIPTQLDPADPPPRLQA